MNVTLKLPDDLCKAAKHRAVDESVSLSKWVARVVEKELANDPLSQRSLLEIVSQPQIPAEHRGKDLPLEDRKEGAVRNFSFDEPE